MKRSLTIHLTDLPNGGQLNGRGKMTGGISTGVNCPGGSCPGALSTGGNCPGVIARGNCPGSNCQRRKLSRGVVWEAIVQGVIVLFP